MGKLREKVKRIWQWIINYHNTKKSEKEFKKRMEELRKKDPFIYK